MKSKIISVVGLLLLMFTPSIAYADDGDVRLTTFVGSYHFKGHNYCEINPGLGVQYFLSDHINLHGGMFKNSTCNTTVFGMIGWESDTSKVFGYGLQVGVLSGYSREYDFPTAPIGGFPYLRFGSNKSLVHVKIVILPISNGLLGLSFSWRL